MSRLQTLLSFKCLLTLLFVSGLYIVCFTIPASYRSQIWNNLNVNSLIVNNQTEQLERFQYQDISDCLCSRKWMYPPTINQLIKTGSRFKGLNSSCSDEGTHYQTNQNVISFSLFAPQKSTKLINQSNFTSPLNFQLGVLQNLLMMRKHYPGYSIRVYSSVPLDPYGPFCELLCQNEDLFWCDIEKTPSHGNLSWTNSRTWRFLPLGDPTVNIFHVRDLDSLISHREAAAAEDWLSNSGKCHKAIIVMRDSKGNHNVPMLGGMWAADNSKLLENGDKLRQQLILKSQPSKSQGKGLDQKYLNSVIFYPMVKDILAYDSYHCVKWSNFTEVRPFPTRQTEPGMGFVGNYVRFLGNGTESKKWKVFECPLECRPSYGLDWKYC